jgi:hypothetical protein
MPRLEAYTGTRQKKVVATLDYLVHRNPDGSKEMVDFQAHQDAGRKLRQIWDVEQATGSRVKPDGA